MKDSKQLSNRAPDYVASSLKASLGAIPGIGSLLSEVISVVIPNQRVDRLADFARRLADKLDDQQRTLVEKRIIEPEGIEILEEALWQSARALTGERRDRIAGIVKNGFTKTELDLLETKKLLQLLSQVSDLELILLRLLMAKYDQDKALREKFPALLRPPPLLLRSSQTKKDALAISSSMRAHLIQLGLIQPRYSYFRDDELPPFDPESGGFKSSGHTVTLLGSLLLRAADFMPEENKPTEPKADS